MREYSFKIRVGIGVNLNVHKPDGNNNFKK